VIYVGTTNAPEPDDSSPGFQSWPDGSAVAVVTWHDASGEVYQQEVPDEREALDLMRKVTADEQLDLVSVQVRRAGIGPGS
jgi:hypothetical protein